MSIYLPCPQSHMGWNRGRPKQWVYSADKETWANETDNLIRMFLVNLPSLCLGEYKDWRHHIYLLELCVTEISSKRHLGTKGTSHAEIQDAKENCLSTTFTTLSTSSFLLPNFPLHICPSTILSDKSDHQGMAQMNSICHMQYQSKATIQRTPSSSMSSSCSIDFVHFLQGLYYHSTNHQWLP